MQSAKCIVHGAMMHGAMVHRGENEDHNVLQLSREARVCSCTRLRVVFHIERVERHIKMISELICGFFWSPLYSAMEPSSIQPYPMMQKLLCCVFVIES